MRNNSSGTACAYFAFLWSTTTAFMSQMKNKEEERCFIWAPQDDLCGLLRCIPSHPMHIHSPSTISKRRGGRVRL